MDSALEEWRSIVELVDRSIDGLDDKGLDRACPDPGMTIRELVHHLTEANVVAASIVIAALGSPGCTYDWSWMQPFGPWMDRLDYRSKPVGPSLTLLRALNAWVAAIVQPLPDGLSRPVALRDAPGADLRTATVADVLREEARHAREHVASIHSARASR